MEGGKVGEKWHSYIIVSKVKKNKQNAKVIQEVEKESPYTLSTEVCGNKGAVFWPLLRNDDKIVSSSLFKLETRYNLRFLKGCYLFYCLLGRKIQRYLVTNVGPKFQET